MKDNTKLTQLITRYLAFALLASAANLSVQAISQSLYTQHYSLYVAMFFGTLVGLLVKYNLDKRYIFRYIALHQWENSISFVFYSFMGVFTTLIFWGVEILFDRLIDASWGSYLGATIGLAIGYSIKYQLDKHFVFRSRNAH
ncbi:MAG: hypothetical protein KU37_00050 [Sulfuricurvum sp. PC08-66]|nr:MAG: hypothetical protein KU37_00050 [Sulfuricurvum sp. PC08-66]